MASEKYVTCDQQERLWYQQLFDTEADALAFAEANWKSLVRSGEVKVRRATWREVGQYTPREPMPWQSERWWRNRSQTLVDHFPRKDEADPRLIAFFESPEKAELGRLTKMKPGRYLQKYFTDLGEKKINYYVEWWISGKKPVTTFPGELKFAMEPDEIVQVYKDGPQSCMKGSTSVRIYGAGDLGIAYVLQSDGKIISRALCWPEKKIYGRIYPNTDNWRTDGWESPQEADEVRADLENRLRDQGFVSLRENERGFDGARLLCIIEEHQTVMPYLDNGMYWDEHPTDKKHLVLTSNGGHTGDNTHGYADHLADHVRCCEVCGDVYDPDEGEETLYGHWDRSPRTSYTVCIGCYESRSFYCEATEHHYLSTNAKVKLDDGRTVLRSWARHTLYQWVDGTWHEEREPLPEGTTHVLIYDPDRERYRLAAGNWSYQQSSGHPYPLAEALQITADRKDLRLIATEAPAPVEARPITRELQPGDRVRIDPGADVSCFGIRRSSPDTIFTVEEYLPTQTYSSWGLGNAYAGTVGLVRVSGGKANTNFGYPIAIFEKVVEAAGPTLKPGDQVRYKAPEGSKFMMDDDPAGTTYTVIESQPTETYLGSGVGYGSVGRVRVRGGHALDTFYYPTAVFEPVVEEPAVEPTHYLIQVRETGMYWLAPNDGITPHRHDAYRYPAAEAKWIGGQLRSLDLIPVEAPAPVAARELEVA